MKNFTSIGRHVDSPTEVTGTVAPSARLVPGRSSDAEARAAFQETRYGWLVLAVVWTASVAYLAAYLRTGWFPYDAGHLAEAAERVLSGQVPHLNFEAVYTGGLAYFDALAFRLFGTNFFSLRIPLFLCFLGWVPAFYLIARRFTTPLVAGTITLLAVAWSIPNYPVGTAGAYDLFLATWGTLALLRYTETEKQRWIWIAGLCGGLSFLVKIVGLYFVAGCFLFFVFREAAVSAGSRNGKGRSGLGYLVFATAGLLLFLVALSNLISQRPAFVEYFYFLLPSASVAGFVLWELWRWSPRGEPAGKRFRRLFSMLLPFLGGLAAPIAVFLAWFAYKRALAVWFTGTFFRSTIHLHWEAYNAISPIVLLGLVPAVLLLLLAWDSNPAARTLARYGGPLALAALLLAAWKSFAVYSFVSYSLPLLIPILALAVLFCLRHGNHLPDSKRQQTFLIVTVAATGGLLLFPSAAALYFCYVAPLLILGLAALGSMRKRAEPVAIGALLGFYLVFALWLHPPAFFQQRMTDWGHPLDLQPIALARAGGIRAPAHVAREFEDLVHVVREHAQGKYIYATPDCPEVYFLSGFRNPTGTIFELLDPDFLYPMVRTDRIMSTLRERQVNLVVLGPDTYASLSGPVPPCLRASLDARYPRHAMVGNFEVRWRK